MVNYTREGSHLSERGGKKTREKKGKGFLYEVEPKKRKKKDADGTAGYTIGPGRTTGRARRGEERFSLRGKDPTQEERGFLTGGEGRRTHRSQNGGEILLTFFHIPHHHREEEATWGKR